MKKLFLSALSIAAFALTSCGGSATFWGKTFVLKSTFNNLDEVLSDDSTRRKDLSKNFNQIDWSQCSPAITDHSSVNATLASMESQALAIFAAGTYGNNFSIQINPESSGFATVTKGGSSTGYKAAYSSQSGSIFELKDASQYTCYALYHVYSENGNFKKVMLRAGNSDIGTKFTLLYNEPIEETIGIEITYWANYLPQ